MADLGNPVPLAVGAQAWWRVLCHSESGTGQAWHTGVFIASSCIHEDIETTEGSEAPRPTVGFLEDGERQPLAPDSPVPVRAPLQDPIGSLLCAAFLPVQTH